MKPQLKPFNTITSEAIWSSATHWMLLYAHAPFAICSKCYGYEESQAKHGLAHQIYPFAYHEVTGEIIALPWPLMPGDVEIEEWRGFAGEPSRLWRAGRQHDHVIQWEAQGHRNIKARPGLHPAPRRQINPDGTEKPVWVWEADQ